MNLFVAIIARKDRHGVWVVEKENHRQVVWVDAIEIGNRAAKGVKKGCVLLPFDNNEKGDEPE